jgi:FkbM family methyltransferase
MNRVYTKMRELSRSGQLARALSYKFLSGTGVARFCTFNVRDLRLRLVKSEMTYEAWKSPESYRMADEVFLKQVLRPGGLVVDIGANIGMVTLQAAQLVGASGHVIAVEPQPRIVSYCRENVHLNRLSNVTVIESAVGETNGTVSFNCDPCDDVSRVVAKGGTTVPLTTLDAIASSQDDRRINLLKIDTEGFELSVLKGGAKTLARTDWVYVEVDAYNYSHYGHSTAEVISLLQQHGFDTYFSDDDGNWQKVDGPVSESINLIGKKRGMQGIPAQVKSNGKAR